LADELTRRLDVAIWVLVGVLLLQLVLRFQNRPNRPSPGPIPDPFPVSAAWWVFPPPRAVGTSDRVSEQTQTMAEALMVRGSQELDRRNLGLALAHFRRAQMMVPGEVRYARQIQRAEHELELLTAWNKVQADLSAGQTDSAWARFSDLSTKDRGFFLARALELADRLQAAGQTASAVSILRAYCQAAPADVQGRDLLVRGLRTLGYPSPEIDEVIASRGGAVQ